MDVCRPMRLETKVALIRLMRLLARACSLASSRRVSSAGRRAGNISLVACARPLLASRVQSCL
eukprot:15482289-Alexandrium_andersonii.AAC.1